MSWKITGHDWAVGMLKQHLARGELRHAYLFTGPQGVGRSTLAIRFAQAINCQQPPALGEACLACRACRQIGKMQHPDLHVIQSEPPASVIKVEQVRELTGRLSRTPYEAKYHIALLLRVEEAHPSAANALLKTLEEPGERVILLLTAESPESVIPTVASRCEILRLRPLSLDLLSKALAAETGISAEEARFLAALSGGRPGYAHHLRQNPEEIDQRNAWLDEHARLLSAKLVDRFGYVEGIYKDKPNVLRLLPVWLSLWRDVLLKAGRASQGAVNLHRRAEIDWLAEAAGLLAAQKMIAALDRTINMFDQNVNPRLALEVLMLDLPYLPAREPLGSV